MNNMYGINPYLNPDELMRYRKEIDNLLAQTKQPQQQAPIQNIISNQPAQNNANTFEFKKLNENDEAENIGVFMDTIFIGEDKMQIKKLDGTIEKYNITKYYPVDPKVEKINELEKKIEELERRLANGEHTKSNTTIQSSNEQEGVSGVNDKSKSKNNDK